MKRGINKSNIDILKDYVAGVRPFIQVGYDGTNKKHRNEGEKWTDTKGIEWEKKNGKTIRLTKTQAEMIRELTTQKCKCGQIIKWGTKLDQKMFNRTGLCANCLIDYETKLRILGIYPDYETYKLISYELGEVKDLKEKIKDVIKFFSKDAGDITMLCNSEGFLERWKHNNPEEILTGAKRDLKLAVKRIAFLVKSKEVAKKRYVENAAKYNLEIYV